MPAGRHGRGQDVRGGRGAPWRGALCPGSLRIPGAPVPQPHSVRSEIPSSLFSSRFPEQLLFSGDDQH